MAKQNLGRVAMVSKGEYSSATNYERLDIVTYQGSSYVCKKDSIGNLPTNTEYFDLLAEKGIDGQDGYTPQKGIDYYTAQEKQEMKSDVITEITPTLNNNLQQAKDYTDNQIINDIKNVTYNTTTGVFVFTKHDNTTITVDLPIEQNVKSGYYDDTNEELVLVLMNDQEIRIPASGLVDVYTGTTSATIQVSISADNKITCNIVGQSISKTLLTTELQTELNGKANTSDVDTELAKKVNNADVEEKDLLVTYEDETTETVKLVVYK